MAVSNSTNRKLGAVLSMANMGVSLIVGLIYTPICVRFLGQSEYGLITFATSLIGYLSILDMGFGTALVRYCNRLREKNEDESNLFGFFLLLFTGIAIVAFILGVIVYSNLETVFSSGFTSHELELLKPIFLLLLFNVILGFPCGVFNSIINSYEKFIFLRGTLIIKYILMHIANISFLFLGANSIGITACTVFFSVLIYIVNIYYCFANLHIRFGFKKFDKEFYKDIITYSFFIFIAMVGNQLYDDADKIILGKFAGSEAVAIYGIGVTFYVYFKMMALSITNVFFPLISKISVQQDSVKQMSILFNRVGRILSISLIFILSGFVFFGQEFTVLWVGEEYMESYWIALIIMIPSLIPWAQQLGATILEALNKHRVNGIMYFAIAVFNVIISIPLAMAYGGIGAAIGTSVGTILGRHIFLNYYYLAKIHLDLKTFYKEFFKICILYIPVFIIFGIGANVPLNLSWINLVIKVAGSCLLAIPYIYLIIMNQSEKDIFLSFKNKLIDK